LEDNDFDISLRELDKTISQVDEDKRLLDKLFVT